MDLLTLNTEPAIESNSVSAMAMLFGVFGFTGVALSAMVLYWKKHAKNANTDFQRKSLLRLLWLTIGVLVNMCILPMVMIFYPIIWIRLVCMFAIGIMIFVYIRKNWSAPIMFVDPEIIKEMKDTIKDNINPALNSIPSDTGIENHVQWAKTGADKLSHLIEKLRAPDVS